LKVAQPSTPAISYTSQQQQQADLTSNTCMYSPGMALEHPPQYTRMILRVMLKGTVCKASEGHKVRHCCVHSHHFVLGLSTACVEKVNNLQGQL
jgi:hypothetical protein